MLMCQLKGYSLVGGKPSKPDLGPLVGAFSKHAVVVRIAEGAENTENTEDAFAHPKSFLQNVPLCPNISSFRVLRDNPRF